MKERNNELIKKSNIIFQKARLFPWIFIGQYLYKITILMRFKTVHLDHKYFINELKYCDNNFIFPY